MIRPFLLSHLTQLTSFSPLLHCCLRYRAPLHQPPFLAPFYELFHRAPFHRLHYRAPFCFSCCCLPSISSMALPLLIWLIAPANLTPFLTPSHYAHFIETSIAIFYKPRRPIFTFVPNALHFLCILSAHPFVYALMPAGSPFTDADTIERWEYMDATLFGGPSIYDKSMS